MSIYKGKNEREGRGVRKKEGDTEEEQKGGSGKLGTDRNWEIAKK